MDRAAISSSAVACMASPHRVYLKKQTKITRSIMAATKLQRYTDPTTIGPKRTGSMENTGGLNTRVSVPQINPTVPLKKKLSPTVTMITVNTGSPISLSRNIRSVRMPRINPIAREMARDSRKGTPME